MPYGNINVDTVTTSTTGGILGAGNASIMKNRIINGAMVIDQRALGVSVTTPTTGAFTYATCDRWAYFNAQANKYTLQQNAGAITPPVGFSHYLGMTSTSAYSVLSSDYFTLSQTIEGLNISDLGWGTANAKTVTLSFQVYSSLTGTFGGSITNSANTRSYPFTYSVSVANTWTTISVTIAGDTSGTWLTTNGKGMIVIFGLGVGSTFSGTASAWSAAQYFSATGATSVVGTNGATFYLTGVQLEIGSSATGFEYRQYGQELALCQRYYYQDPYPVGTANTTLLIARASVPHPVAMRASPTVTVSSAATFLSGATGVTATGAIVNYSTTSTWSADITTGGTMAVNACVTKIGGTGLITVSAEL
jgi:hypothetical protein